VSPADTPRLAHRAEKWIRFSLTRTSGSASNDAPLKI
jgi:hypothetical protein